VTDWNEIIAGEPAGLKWALGAATRLAFIDIDHTLANSFWRDPMIGVSSWDEYHEAGRADKPFPETVALVNSLQSSGWWVIGLTGRPERFRQMTMKWLLDYGVMIDQLVMRANDDFRSTPDYKLAEARAIMAAEENILAIVFDDRDDVCAAFKAAEIVAVQVQIAGVRNGKAEKAQHQDASSEGRDQTDGMGRWDAS
jgi:phosphoglycolate phosphatase-like HAD superfamily hydrolase